MVAITEESQKTAGNELILPVWLDTRLNGIKARTLRRSNENAIVMHKPKNRSLRAVAHPNKKNSVRHVFFDYLGFIANHQIHRAI